MNFLLYWIFSAVVVDFSSFKIRSSGIPCRIRYFFIPSFFTDYSLPHGFNAAGHPAPHGRTHAKGGNPPMQADPDGPAGKNPGDGEVKQKRSTAVAGLSYRPG